MYQNSRVRRPFAPAKRQRASKWPFIIAVLVISLILFGAFIIAGRGHDKTASGKKEQTAAPAFDKTQHSLNDPTSIWVVVNKQRPLSPKTYAPDDLRAPAIPLRRSAGDSEMQVRDEAAAALEALAVAAKTDGANFMLASGYRSYDQQVVVYGSEVKGYGQAVADQESARPGHSEHQTGLAADLEPTSRKCEIEDCFKDTVEGKWLAAHAYEYGFILRYTPDKVAVTGYKYEPWHVRYIGTELAAELHRRGIKTLEEFFNLPAAPNY